MKSRIYDAPSWRAFTGWTATIAVVVAAVLAMTSTQTYAIATAVPLGTAESFAVLGGQSVTNTGPTVVNGDLGVSPGTAISGFPPGLVNGAVHSADAVALQAQTDLTVAYNDAAGQAPDASIAGDLGGLTLLPGVYNASSSIGLTGTLTLDAQRVRRATDPDRGRVVTVDIDDHRHTSPPEPGRPAPAGDHRLSTVR